MQVSYDAERDIVTIDGARYNASMFRCPSKFKDGTWIRIEVKPDGTRTMYMPNKMTCVTLDVVAGRAPWTNPPTEPIDDPDEKKKP